jgi:uncharacterized membrane protein
MRSGSCVIGPGGADEHFAPSATLDGWGMAMRPPQIVWGEDLPDWALVAGGLLLVSYLVFAILDTRVGTRRRRLLLATDVLSVLLVAAVVLRPMFVTATSTPFGARVAVLVDGSRRLDVNSGSTTRAEAARRVVAELESHFRGTRLSFYEFGRGPLHPLRHDAVGEPAHEPFVEDSGQSDLTGALEQLENQLGERPAAVVVVSDGRVMRPAANAEPAAFAVPSALRGTVVHAVDVGGKAPPDASVLAIETSGTAVAHQSLSVDVVVGCLGGLSCGRVPVSLREHKRGSLPAVLATGEVVFSGEETARISLEVTIERAGTRVIEVAIAPPTGDAVKENDVRMLAIQVVRDRLRLLHVAGRPTYDVRALRNWLKSDSSVDLVSFFILRTDSDDANVDEDSELALIPFPVDELFDEHLPSFDAVLLGDIDAERYRLSRYLGNLARYVEQGGGLILIGGPSAFAGGAYASSPIERVLPVTLTNTERPFDTVEFVPRLTNAGRDAALLAPLRSVLGEVLPNMPGANSFGVPRGRAVVLWEHSSRNVLPVKTGGAPGAMPVLAVSEVGDGRVVALGVDGTHRLAFGPEAARTGGRGFGALWDGLLGWVIRDPRFEAAHGEILGECIASVPVRARITLGASVAGELAIEVERLSGASGERTIRRVAVTNQRSLDVELGVLPAGAYSALARLGEEPAARFDFACESGGTAWADTRPDPTRLAQLAKANGGKLVSRNEVSALPIPTTTLVHGSRRARPILGVWIWALLAAGSLALNWLLRRTDGLA